MGHLLTTQGIQHFKRREEWVSSALMAEGIAMREAVLYCAEAGMKKVKFESDSLQLIKVLNTGSPVTELYGVAADILSLGTSFEFVSFSWIPRERNSVADSLAKDALIVSEINFCIREIQQ